VDPGRHRCTLRAARTLALATALVHRAWKQEQVERLESDRLATSLDLDKGLSLCENGAPARGLLRLSHALSIPAPGEAADLRRAILANLAAWQAPLCPLREILPHHGVVYAVACSPDGKVLLTGGGVVVSGGSGARPGFGMPPLASPSARPCGSPRQSVRWPSAPTAGPS